VAEPAGRLLSPLHYYGAKARLTPWIVSLLPAHRVYLELFFGSGAVLFAKPPATHEIVNDLDHALVCFLRTLRDHPQDLKRACRLTPYARAEFEAADLATPDLIELELPRRFWVRSAGAFNKCVNGRRSWASSPWRGSNEATSAMRLVDRMAAAAERLRRVSIEWRPAVEVIGRYGTSDAVIYCDPPYLAGTRRALDRHRQSDYRFDYSSEAEHRGLAAALHATPATVLLSGYPNELYADLYSGWWRVEWVIARPSTNVAGASGGPAVECIWSNRPLAGQLRLLEPEAAVEP
jgi:DNA adenine methylase